MKTNPSSIETLESRIAPAALFTYTDVDGDSVTINASKGSNADLAAILTFDDVNPLNPRQLQKIDFSANAAVFAGTGLTVSATLAGNGDGLVNVGYVDATGSDGGTALDLGVVKIHGDLGRINSGDATVATVALKTLDVQSMGRFGTSTQNAGNLNSTINGNLGSLKIGSDIDQASIVANNNISSVSVGGSVIGGTAANSGQIFAGQAIGSAKIGQDLRGGNGDNSGQLFAGTSMGTATVGGSLIGGSLVSGSTNSGQIFAGTAITTVKVTGDVIGGAGDNSGQIFAGTSLNNITAASLIGGDGTNSGQIFCGTTLGTVKIAGAVVGAVGDNSGQIFAGTTLKNVTAASVHGGGSGATGTNSGQIFAGTSIGSVKITTDVVGGGGANSGQIFAGTTMTSAFIGGSVQGGDGDNSGQVYSGTTLGTVKITGSLNGSSGANSGQVFAGTTLSAVTIGGDLVGGSDSNSGQIYAGLNLTKVTIGGSVMGGSGTNSGQIGCGQDAASIKITGNLEGGSQSGAGEISIGGNLVNATIGGSVLSGTVGASIRAGDAISNLTIGGSVIGKSGALAEISARGQSTPSTTADVAISKLSIAHNVEFAEIKAGYDTSDVAKNADAQIKSLTVGGDWIASSAAAGAVKGTNGFGTGDTLISGAGTTNQGGILSRIASIVINGQALCTFGGADQFGFVAEQVVSFKVGGTTIPLTPTAHTDNRLIGVTGDVHIHEI